MRARPGTVPQLVKTLRRTYARKLGELRAGGDEARLAGGPFPGQLAYPFGFGIRSRLLPEREKAAMAYFQGQGWTKAQAAGIVASLEAESGRLPNPPGLNDWGRAHGMGQWEGDRVEEFRRWAGHDIKKSTPEEQLAFVQYELTKGLRKAAGDALRRAQSATEAGVIVSRRYESPKDVEGAAKNRAALAARIDVRVNNNTGGNANVQAAQAAAQ